MKNTLAPGVPLAIVLSAAVATVALRAAARRQQPRRLPGAEPELVTATADESRPWPAVTVGTQQISFGGSNIEVVNVYGGSNVNGVSGATGNMTFDVRSTSSTVTTTVQTAGTSNVINVGSTAGALPASAGVLGNIQGAVDLVGSGHDTANVDDSGDSLSQTGYLTSTQLTGLGLGSQGDAQGDSVQPGSERPVEPDCRRSASEDHEGGLNRVFGFLFVSQSGAAHGPHQPGVAANHDGEGDIVMLLDESFQELRV